MSNDKTTIIEIAIFENYGGNALPDFIEEQIKHISSTVDRRIKLAEIIKALPNTHSGEIPQKDYNQFSRRRNSYLKCDLDESFVFFTDSYGIGNPEKPCNPLRKPYTSNVRIIEVDTSKLWKIASYDGAEAIKYLDFHMLDSKYNYGDF